MDFASPPTQRGFVMMTMKTYGSKIEFTDEAVYSAIEAGFDSAFQAGDSDRRKPHHKTMHNIERDLVCVGFNDLERDGSYTLYTGKYEIAIAIDESTGLPTVNVLKIIEKVRRTR